MSDHNVNCFIAQGETHDSGSTRFKPTQLGQEVPFPHKLTAGGAVLSGMVGKAVPAMNDSGGALTPGQAVRWKSGYFGTRIGAAAGAGEPADGFIDHTIPAAGVANGSACLVVTYGPCRMVSDGAATLAIHDRVKTAASGKVTKDTATPVSNGKCARVMDTSVTNVDGTAFWGFIDGPP